MTTALAFLTRHWARLALDRFGSPSDLSCITWTPRFRASAHVVSLILARGSRDPALVVKASRLPGDSGPLIREAANLRAVHAARPGGFDSVPRLLACEEYAGTHLLVETAVPGRTMKPAVVRRRPGVCAEAVLAWLEDLGAATTREADRGPSFELLVARPLEQVESLLRLLSGAKRLIVETRGITSALGDHRFPLVFEHGDLSAPNILLSNDDELGVVDWELAEPAGLPASDLFFALGYLAFARRGARKTPDHVAAFHDAFFGPTAWAGPYVEHYAEHLGLASEVLRPIFVATWLRYVAKLATRLGSLDARQGLEQETVAWLQQNRYFALWRHCVQNFGELLPPDCRRSR